MNPSTRRDFVEPVPQRAPMPAAALHPHGDLRMGPLLPVPQLLREFGVDAATVLARAGIDRHMFDDAERRIAFRDAGRLLDVCVDATGCAHFGLLVGQRFAPTTLGMLGELLRHCETVDSALRSLSLYLHLNDSGAVPVMLRLDAKRFAAGYSVVHSQTRAAAQIQDGAIAITWQLLRSLCGAFWAPLEVTFAHGKPADVGPFSRFFGAPLRFDAELTAVVFPARWLAQRIEGADAARHAQLRAALHDAMSAHRGRLDVRVRRALQAMIFAGTDSAPALARVFGLHERALRRQLLAEGTRVQVLTRQARFDLSTQLLRDTRLSMAEIASALHYADATAFSRAFRRWAGCTPSAWRERAAATVSSDDAG